MSDALHLNIFQQPPRTGFSDRLLDLFLVRMTTFRQTSGKRVVLCCNHEMNAFVVQFMAQNVLISSQGCVLSQPFQEVEREADRLQ